MATVIVAAGLIVADGCVLLTQRRKDAHQGLKWEFPGGKLEPGESLKEALARELKEELDIRVEVTDFYTSVFYRYPEFDILLLVYRAEISEGAPRPLGCRQLLWATPDKMRHLDMPPADIAIRDKVLTEGFTR